MDVADSSKHKNAESERESLPVILIVENDTFLREILVKKFTEERFRVERAAIGSEAMRLFNEHPPHCVLLDVVLPDIDGFEVLQRIRQTAVGAKIPVVILGNLGRPEDIKRAGALGANEYLPKINFTSDEIVGRIRKILRDHYVELR